LQKELLRGIAESVLEWRQLAARLDLCLCLEDDRLSEDFLGMPVSHLEVALGCTDRAPRGCDKHAVEARAASCLAAGGGLADTAVLSKLLLAAAWVGASVPAVVERLMTKKVGYEELKALGACLKNGASGPMMDLLQVGGRGNTLSMRYRWQIT
jgi:hypothetical protein